jgi:hypothetical protein
VVAYGSLMSLQSMEKTLGHKYEGPVRRVHLTGYERAWTGLAPIQGSFLKDKEQVPFVGTVSMNVRPRKGGRFNAILYVLTGADLVRLDKRERGYRRVDAADKLEEFEVSGGKAFIYEGLSTREDGSPFEKGTYIVIREFYDLVTGACDSIGKDFREEFDATTRPCEYPIVPFRDIAWSRVE